MSERLKKTIAKNNRYRSSNKKGWDTRKRLAAAKVEQPKPAKQFSLLEAP